MAARELGPGTVSVVASATIAESLEIMKHIKILLLAVATIFLVIDATAQPCRKVFFNQQPGWVTHAEWSGQELLMADNLRASVLGFKKDGRPTPAAAAAVGEALSSYSADLVEFKKAPKGDWLLQLAPNKFVRPEESETILDLQSVEVQVRTLAAKKELGVEKLTLRLIHEWVIAGDDLVLIADLTDFTSPSKKERHFAGVVRVELSEGPSLGVKRAVLLGEAWPFNSPTWRRYRVIWPTLAASDSRPGEPDYGRVFFLELDETPEIYFNDPGSGELRRLKESTPEEYRATSPPDIPDVSLQNLTLIMAGVESTPFVAGLYFWESHLYVLHREPTVGRSTEWSLIKVAAETGKALGQRTLPTRATHLVVAPGDTWAFIEKGPYLGFGNQKIPSAYLIDAEAIRKFQPTLCSNGD